MQTLTAMQHTLNNDHNRVFMLTGEDLKLEGEGLELAELIQQNDLKQIEYFLKNKRHYLNRKEDILLYCKAIDNKNAMVVKCFLKNGIDPAPLNILPQSYDPLLRAIATQQIEILKILVETRLSILFSRKAEDKNLIHAVLECSGSDDEKLAMMQILLKTGVLIADNSKWQSIPKNSGILELLNSSEQFSKLGMQMYNIETGPNMKCLILLRFAEDLLLLAMKNNKSRQDRYDLCLKELGEAINGRDLQGSTALHYEINNRNKENILCLLDAKANIDIINFAGKTAYDLAIESKDPFLRALFMTLAFTQQISRIQAFDDLLPEDANLGDISFSEIALNPAKKRLKARNNESEPSTQNLQRLGSWYYKFFTLLERALSEIISEEEIKIITDRVRIIANNNSIHDIYSQDILIRLQDILKIRNTLVLNKTMLERLIIKPKENTYINRLGSTLLAWCESHDIKYRDCKQILQEAAEQCPKFNINDDFEIMNGSQYSDLVSGYSFMHPIRKNPGIYGVEISYSVQLYAGHSLCAAVGLQEREIAQLLLEHGADANHLCGTSSSPLYGAVYNNDIEMVKLLLKNGARVEVEHVLAAKMRYEPILQLLLAASPDFDRGWLTNNRPTLLFYAVMYQDIELVESVASNKKCDLSTINESYTALLHYLVAHPQWTGDLLNQNQKKILRLLESEGLDPNLLHPIKLKKDNQTQLMLSPLMLAIQQKNKAMFEALLSFKNINLETASKETGETALIQAVRLSNNAENLFFIEKLIHLGANLQVTNNLGQTALMLAGNKEKNKINTRILTLLVAKECRQYFESQRQLDNKRLDTIDNSKLDEFLNNLMEVVEIYGSFFTLNNAKNLAYHSMWLPAQAFAKIVPAWWLLHVKEFQEDDSYKRKTKNQHRIQIGSDKNLTLKNMPKVLCKIYQQWYKECIKLKANPQLNFIIEKIWEEMPLKQSLKQRGMCQHATDNGVVERFDRGLLNLPKQMLEISSTGVLSEIYKLSSEIKTVLAKSKLLNKEPFVDSRKDKRRLRRIETIKRMRYGNQDNSGKPAEDGLYFLVNQAVLQYKNILALQKDFFRNFTGNLNVTFDSTDATVHHSNLMELLVKRPEKHNKTSYLYIESLLKAGLDNKFKGREIIEKAEALLLKLESIRDRALSHLERLKDIQHILQNRLQICTDELSEDRRFDKNPRVKQSAIVHASKKSIVKEKGIDKDKDPVNDPEKAKILTPANEPPKSSLKTIETPKFPEQNGSKAFVVVFSINKEKSAKELNAQIRKDFKDSRSFLKKYQNANVTLQSKTKASLNQWESRWSQRPKGINIARDWQIQSRIQVMNQQNLLRYILETDTKQQKERNYLNIENNALLLSLTLMMEQAKRLRGDNQIFPSEMARKFRNVILHGHSLFPPLMDNIKKLDERNTRLREMAAKMLDWMSEDKQSKLGSTHDISAILKEINCELLTTICQFKIEEPSCDECLLQLKQCSESRRLYAAERNSLDPNILKLAEDFTTALASTYYQTVVCNAAAWRDKIGTDMLACLRLEFGDDVKDGQGIRHAKK